MNPLSRRKFLSQTAIGAGAVLANSAILPGKPASEDSFVFFPKKPVNPFIDNLRVVCGVNPSMITADPTKWDMESQNAPVDAGQVHRTLDAMACSLSQKQDSREAWKMILRKPDGKDSKTVKAAIKVNCIAKNHPRLAVINKLCLELMELGIPAGNIIIYDGVHNALEFYAAYIGKKLPAGVVVSERQEAMGGTVKVKTPEPKAGRYSCSRFLAEGVIDILVNVAVNKGHDQSLGKATLTLKNHAGTFDPMPIHLGGGLDYILAFNKSDAFWGGNPVRQQLCIVDSLWGSVNGPFAVPDKRLDRLVMGTFAGAVDYLTVKKIREPLLNATHAFTERFVTAFGYNEKEVPEMVSVSL